MMMPSKQFNYSQHHTIRHWHTPFSPTAAGRRRGRTNLKCQASQQQPDEHSQLLPKLQVQQQQQPGSEGCNAHAEPETLQLYQQQLSQAFKGKGLQLQYAVPWDIWFFIQVSAAIWIINQSIPYAVLSSAAHLQGLQQLSDLPLVEKEVLGLLCQCAQLAFTYSLLTAATSKHQPLEEPWFWVQPSSVALLQAFAAAVAAVGSGVLLAGAMTGNADGAEEWRQLANLHADKAGLTALALGAVVLAPLTEEVYFRGFVLPSLTKWMHPLAAVLVTGLLFASVHPSSAFPAETLLGCILGLSLLAADGNLLVPLVAHALYNTCVLGTELML